MDGFFELLYAPIQPFVWHPEKAFYVSLIFIALLVIDIVAHKGYIRIKQLWPLLLAFVSWLLFGVNEYIAHSNKTDIRIDLLFFGPLIMAISIFAIYSFVKSLLYRK